MGEFQEIAPAGGKLELLYEEKTGGVALRISSSTTGGWTSFQVGISLDGKRLEYWPIQGIDTREPETEAPMVPAFVISDREMFFGRACPKCQSYFRTSSPGDLIICPYCAHRNINVAFTTKNQLQFVDKIRESFTIAFKERRNVTMDLDQLAKELPENRPPWIYSEERQQNTYQCPTCKTKYDILGEYAGCPRCGKRNSLQVFERHISEVEQQFTKAEKELTERQDREIEWEKLSRCVSDFEAMARDIQSQLILLPATPKRKNDIKSLSFQNIIKASESLQNWFGFEILFRFSSDDQIFLNRMFNRRHVLIHNGGRIDQQYIDNTKDTSVRLNQKIVVRSNEIRRLIPLLRVCADNLFQGFESIKL